MAQGWFDAHLDLAYLAEAGRDMTARAEDVDAPTPPAAVTFPALAEGNVAGVLGTIFIQRRATTAENPHDNANGPWTFSSPEEAHAAALRQLGHYTRWETEGHLRIIRKAADLAAPAAGAPLQTILLMEGAPGLRSPADVPLFFASGLRAVSLCWAEGTPYAGGNGSGGDVTPAGRDLIAELDRVGIVHDVSHLSEAAFWTLMKTARGPKIASHSNCRTLLPGARSPDRHLTDDQIRALADAGGVIGIVLYSKFLVDQGRAAISDVLRHIDHVEKITKRRDCIALGSDMDGGFSANGLPQNLDHPRRLPALASALATAGWSTPEIHAFAWQNWHTFFQRTLPLPCNS